MQVDEVARFGNLHPHLDPDVNGANLHLHAHPPPSLNNVRHQQIQKRLDVLEVKEHEIIVERLKLKSQWNSLLAVTQLPNELLFHIFVYFSEILEVSSKSNDEDGRSFSHVRQAKTRWAKLMLVCHRWYDVALATPALWRTIDVGRTSNWMKLALSRSGSATIDVSFHFSFSEEHASLLQPHCHRLRSLRLRTWSPHALPVICNTLPALETLEIYRDSKGVMIARRVDIGVSHERFPNLRVLQLVHAVVPEDPLFYAGLRRLSLKACSFSASLEHFVQLLSTCAGLEHLELDGFLQNLSNNGNVEPPQPLPSLVSLRLKNHVPIDSARFLSHIVIPQTASLSITAHVRLPEGEPGDTLRAIVPPNFATWLPGLMTVTSAGLFITEDQISITCPSMQSEDGEALFIELALNSPVGTNNGWWHRMPESLGDLLALFGSAPLTRLQIVGNCSIVKAETWASLFHTFPSLVFLDAYADGSLFNGLHDASLASQEDEQIACPGLEHIVVNDPWAASGEVNRLFHPLLRCLRHRSGRGTRLKNLEINLYENEDDTEDYLSQLGDLMPHTYIIVGSASYCAFSHPEPEDTEAFDEESEQ